MSKPPAAVDDDDASTASAFSFWHRLEGSETERDVPLPSPRPASGAPAPSRRQGSPSRQPPPPRQPPRAVAEPPSAAGAAEESAAEGAPSEQGSGAPSVAKPPPAASVSAGAPAPSSEPDVNSAPEPPPAAATLRTGSSNLSSSLVELPDDDDDAPLPPAQVAAAHEEAEGNAGADRATKGVVSLETIPDDEEEPQIRETEPEALAPYDAKIRQGGRRLVVPPRQLSTPTIRPVEPPPPRSASEGQSWPTGTSPTVTRALDQFPDAQASPDDDNLIASEKTTDAVRGQESERSSTTVPPQLLPPEFSQASAPRVTMFHEVEATLVPDEDPAPVIDAVAVRTTSDDDAGAGAGRGSFLNHTWWAQHKKLVMVAVTVLLLVVVVLVAVLATFLLRQDDEGSGGDPAVILAPPSPKPSDVLPQDLEGAEEIASSESPSGPRPTVYPTRLPAIDPAPGAQLPTPPPTRISTSNPTTAAIAQSSVATLIPAEGVESLNSVWINKNVAIHGDTAVVGYPYNGNARGAAFVFAMDANGKWSQTAKLETPDGEADDRFGWSVDMDGDSIVVGAWYDDERRGSAHVFVRDGADWAYQAKLVAPERGIDEQFGGNVGISRDTVVVGAHRDDENGSSAGAAHVFAWNGSEWAYQQKLLPPDGAAFENFGYGVSIDQESIVVGASGDWSGSVYVFVRYGFDWALQSKIYAPDGTALDYFGRSVDIYSETIAVGAFGDDDNGDTSGSAHVFEREDNAWLYQAKLIAPDATTYDWFGYSVAIHEDLIVVGAQYDNDGGTNSGSAHVFERSGSKWQHQTKLVAPDAAAGDRFGRSVAINEGTALIGSHQGNSYVFSS